MKKLTALFLLTIIFFTMFSCSKIKNIDIAIIFPASGSVNNSYDKSILNGVIEFADENGLLYNSFIAEENSQTEFRRQMEAAADSDAQLIICAGNLLAEEVEHMQDKYPKKHFLLVDASIKSPKENTHCITFKEEQAGFIAGYSAVSEGYRRLGFVGSEETEAVTQYGYGFLQGVNYAAYQAGLLNITVEFWYSGQTEPGDALRAKMREWYANGCDIIFSCAEGAVNANKSIVFSANEYKKYVIGAESDKAGESERYLTSAIKHLKKATENAVKAFFDNERAWDLPRGGKTALFGIEQDMVGLPTSFGSFRFKNFDLEAYENICNKIKNGDVLVSSSTVLFPQTEYITVNIREDILTEETSEEESPEVSDKIGSSLPPIA